LFRAVKKISALGCKSLTPTFHEIACCLAWEQAIFIENVSESLFMMNFSTFRQAWSQARTQILVWYIILMTSSTVGAILAIRYTLFLELEARIEASLRQEIEEFERLKADRNLHKGKPLAENIATLFDVFCRKTCQEMMNFLSPS
jgi:hypothetical protein